MTQLAAGRPGRPAALPGRRRLLRRGGAGGGRPGRRGRPALLAALAAGNVGVLHPPAAPGLVTAARLLVHRGPRPPLRLLFRHAAALIPLGDVLRLALLLSRVLGLVASGHDSPSKRDRFLQATQGEGVAIGVPVRRRRTCLSSTPGPGRRPGRALGNGVPVVYPAPRAVRETTFFEGILS